MKLPPSNILLPPRGGALRGLFYTRVVHGKTIIARWPQKRRVPVGAREKANRERILAMTYATLYMDAHQQLLSRELSEKTTLLPRDLLMMAIGGRIGTVFLDDGRKVFSMAAVQDVSSLLDTIAQLPNHMLVRGSTWWQPLAPGDPDQVLSIAPDGTLYWRDSTTGGPGEGHWFFNAPPMQITAASTTITTNFWVGLPVIPTVDTEVSGVRCWLVTGAGITVGYPAIYEATAAGALTGGTLLAQGPPTTAVLGQIMSFPLDGPTLLIGGHVYYVGLNIRGSGSYATAQGVARPNQFFALASNTAPATAPAATAQSSNNNPIWAY